MTSMQFCDDLAGGQIQYRKHCRRAVTHVIVNAPLRYARSKRENRLRPFECLDLALLIHTLTTLV